MLILSVGGQPFRDVAQEIVDVASSLALGKDALGVAAAEVNYWHRCLCTGHAAFLGLRTVEPVLGPKAEPSTCVDEELDAGVGQFELVNFAETS